ncbi:unnamed protein product, partial [Phaeothamnion confervicola]
EFGRRIQVGQSHERTPGDAAVLPAGMHPPAAGTAGPRPQEERLRRGMERLARDYGENVQGGRKDFPLHPWDGRVLLRHISVDEGGLRGAGQGKR